MKHRYELKWEGPFGFSDLFQHINKFRFQYQGKGIYLWMLEKQIFYIGKALGAPSLIQRQLDHYVNIIGARWSIPRDNEKEWIPNQYPENNEIILLPQEFKRLVDDAFVFANNLEIYLCPLKESNQTINAIERSLLYRFKPKGTKWGTKTKPELFLEFRHIGLACLNNFP